MVERRRDAEPAVSLRDVIEEDLNIFFDDQRDPEAVRMAALPARDEAAHRSHWTRILGDETLITKTIVCDGTVAGNVVSWEADGRRMVGYWISRAHWGRGLGTAALARLLELIDTRPLYAYVATANVGSIRILEKCGFRPSAAPTAGDDGVEEVLMELPGPFAP